MLHATLLSILANHWLGSAPEEFTEVEKLTVSFRPPIASPVDETTSDTPLLVTASDPTTGTDQPAPAAPTSEPMQEEHSGIKPPPEPQAEFTLDGPWYYPAKYLHRLPVPYPPIKPVYPKAAGNQEGRVEFELLISAKGEVEKLTIIRAEPEGLFESAVIDAFSHASFAPGLITGYPVKSRLLLEITFRPEKPDEIPAADKEELKKYLTLPDQLNAAPSR